jgi:hypothetical protein
MPLYTGTTRRVGCVCLISLAAVVSMAGGVAGQTTTWLGGTGNWSWGTYWSNGEPNASMDAWINGNVLVGITDPGEECRYLVLGAWDPNQCSRLDISLGGLTCYQNMSIEHGLVVQGGGGVIVLGNLELGARTWGNNLGMVEANYILASGALQVLGDEIIGTGSRPYFTSGDSFTQGSGSGNSYINMYVGHDAPGKYVMDSNAVLGGVGSLFVGCGASGEFDQVGGANICSEQLVLASGPYVTGTYLLLGGELATHDTYVGFADAYLAHGDFRQYGGNHAIFGSLAIGIGCDGNYTLADGWVTEANMLLGISRNGRFFQTGGKNRMTDGFYMGLNRPGDGWYYLTGGDIYVDPNAPVYVGYSGEAYFEQGDGNATFNGDMYLAYNSDGFGTYNLTGGRLQVGGNVVVGGSKDVNGGEAMISVGGGVASLDGNVRIWPKGLLSLGGGLLHASSSGSYVNVFSDGNVTIPSGTHHLGDILPLGTTLAGTTTVQSTATLSVSRILQKSLVVEGNLVIRPSTAGTTSIANTLNIAGSTDNWSGTLDIGNNYLVVREGNLAVITNQIKSGLNLTSGYWDGKGISSSTAAADTSQLTAVGVARASDLGITQFGDASNLTGPEILVRTTMFGDCNLDGTVDVDNDYNLWLAGFYNYQNDPNLFDPNLTGWFCGDFNYDGTVDFDLDYHLWLAGFAACGGNLLALPLEVVPEPCTLALIGIAFVGLFARRGRR